MRVHVCACRCMLVLNWTNREASILMTYWNSFWQREDEIENRKWVRMSDKTHGHTLVFNTTELFGCTYYAAIDFISMQSSDFSHWQWFCCCGSATWMYVCFMLWWTCCYIERLNDFQIHTYWPISVHLFSQFSVLFVFSKRQYLFNV